MADLTSLYRNNPKRDIAIQACADCLHKVGLLYPNEFLKGFFTDNLDIAGGTQPPKSRFVYSEKEGYIRFLQIRDFASEDTPTYIPISKNNKLCNDDDIVLGRYGASVGKILTGKSGAYNVACAKVLFLNDQVDRDYLFYWLHSSYFQNYITSISRSAQGGFNKNDLSRIVTLFPSIEIQKRFVSILKEIDNSIINEGNLNLNYIEVNTDIERDYILFVSKFLSIINEKDELNTELTYQLTLVKQLRQSFLREAMQGKLTADFRNAHPELIKGENSAQALLEKIKAEKDRLISNKKLKIGRITEQSVEVIDKESVPDNWVWCKTDDIFFVTKLAGFEYTEHIRLQNNGEVPVVRAQNIRPMQIDKTNVMFIDNKTSMLLSRCALTKQCLLVTFIGAGIGDVATFNEPTRWHLAPNVAKMEPFEGCEEYVNVRFVNYFLVSKLGQNELFKHIKATAQPSLSMGTIRDIDIPLPPLSEQQAIVSKLDELMRTCDELEASIRSSQQQNEMLLREVLREALEG